MKQSGKFVIAAALGLGVDVFAFRTLLGAGLELSAAHIASFVLAAAASLVLIAREIPWSDFPKVFVVGLLAIFLRGGVLSVAIDIWGMPREAAIFPAIASGAIVSYVGMLHVLAARTPDWRRTALEVVIYALALRLAFLASLNLLPQEAYYWNYAQHLDIGYLDHPPMVAWLIWAATRLFGDVEFGVRFGAYLCWLVAAAFCFRLTQELYGKTAAVIAVLLLATLPFFFAIGLVMTPDAPLTAAWAGALFYLARALLQGRGRAWLGVGVCLGLGMLSKYTIALLGPAALLFMAMHPAARTWLRRAAPYQAVLIAAALFMPVIVWNAQNDWASFAFQGSRRVSGALRFSLPELLGSALLLLSPVGFVAAAKAMMPRAIPSPDGPPRIDARSLFVLIFTVVPLAVFVLFSLFHEVKLNWTGPLWLAVLPKLAAGIESGLAALASGARLARRLWVATIAGLLILYGASLHYLALGLPGVGYAGNFAFLPVAWREFGRQAAIIEENFETLTGEQALRVGLDRYYLSSQMAFYDPLDKDGAATTAGRSIVGGDSLMYDRWFPAQRQHGRTVILFALDSEELSNPAIESRFGSIEPVREQLLYKGSKPVGRFYYRVGHDYRPS